jgi:hypothetical protein
MNQYDNPYYISPAKFMEVLQEGLESAFDTSWDEEAHPEDVGYTIQTAVEHIRRTLGSMSDRWWKERESPTK